MPCFGISLVLSRFVLFYSSFFFFVFFPCVLSHFARLQDMAAGKTTYPKLMGMEGAKKEARRQVSRPLVLTLLLTRLDHIYGGVTS